MLVERLPKILLPPASGSAPRVGASLAPPSSADRLRLATEAAGVALWSWALDIDEITIDEHAFDLWGIARTDA